jgi:type II secretory ATPase GspE/PulE/Tfp pilus assembly ATPase PilB-like protein
MSDPAASRRPAPLGESLVTLGVITHDQLSIALAEQSRTKAAALGTMLVNLGFVTESALRDVLAKNFGKQRVDLSQVAPSEAAFKLVPKDLAKRFGLFPISFDAGTLTLKIAIEDPSDVRTIDRLKAHIGSGHQIETCLAAKPEILAAIDRHYGHVLSIDGILEEIETGRADSETAAEQGEYSSPVPRLVNAILTDAIQRRASDIHFEPENGFVRIRYRIDGVMRQIRSLHEQFWPPMAVRLKLMAKMNIAESRAPQDGHMQLVLNGRRIDFRMASQPTVHGENFVLRVLDRDAGLISLEGMGLTADQIRGFETMLARPEGMILITGPTGSGKTTTLYSLITRMNDESVNIMTLEDPVEYTIPMIRQTNLSGSNTKMEFNTGIRSLMRQDPDIILLGEVRDAETATMALRAAMTGHKVFSTLHTNSAIGAFARLGEFGLSGSALTGNLIGIVGQRLARRLCQHCKMRAPHAHPDALAVRALGRDSSNVHIAREGGCAQCDQLGFRGRIALLEILVIDDELDALVAESANPTQLFASARARGFVTLPEDAMRRIEGGVTSITEAGRIVDLTRLRPRVQATPPDTASLRTV